MKNFYLYLFLTLTTFGSLPAWSFDLCTMGRSGWNIFCYTLESSEDIDIFRAPNRFDDLMSIENQLDTSIPTHLKEIDNKTPSHFYSERYSWMDYRWGMEKGIIGARYNDAKFNAKTTLPSRLQYVRDYPYEKIIEKASGVFNRNPRMVLSPAEKYDLLVGDIRGTLSKKMWQLSLYQHEHGGITSWMGLCEGSAAAGVMVNEPVKNVTYTDPIYGEEIQFSPLDVKALVSLSYSEFGLKLPIVGGRCNFISTETPECKSINPATWFRALRWIAGRNENTLYIDSTPTLEVWNMPILSYEMNYVNLKTHKKSSKFEDSLIEYENYRSSDPYSDVRHPQTKALVGVQMMILTPSGYTESQSGPQASKLVRRYYVFDLELDADSKILGGEWHSDARPDFIWALKNGFFPTLIADSIIGNVSWDSEKVPQEWLRGIKIGSQKGQPMSAIVQRLLRDTTR